MVNSISNSTYSSFSILQPGLVTDSQPLTPEILRAVNESPDRSRIPASFLNQLREFDEQNNLLRQILYPVQTAEDALKLAKTELADLAALVDEATRLQQNPGATTALDGWKPGTPLPPLAASTSSAIEETTLVSGAMAGHRLSVSSDNGEDFTFVFSGAPTSWGDVLSALNAAKIGVSGRIDRTGPDGPRLRLESTDGKTGFRIDGSSSWAVVDDLAGLVSPYDGALAAAQFDDGEPPSGRVRTGLTFGYGASLVSESASDPITAGSSLRFTGSDGLLRRWTATTDTSLRQFALDVNAMRGSVVAEMTGEGRLRLRDTAQGQVSIGAAVGSFDATSGALKLKADIAAPSQPGLDSDWVAARPTGYIDRNSVVAGAVNGMRLSLTTDRGSNFTFTFGMAANVTTWGDIADALDAANIGLKIRFDENHIGSSRMTLYAVDSKMGFRIDGTSSRDVVDDMFGMVSPYDGAFKPEKFARGKEWPQVGIEAPEQGMTFGIGGALQTRATARPIAYGSSLTFIDGDGVQWNWVGTGTSTSPITFIQDLQLMGANVKAELTSDRTIRLRSGDGREIRVIGGTGDFDPANGELAFVTAMPPPATPPVMTTTEQIEGLGRVIGRRLDGLVRSLSGSATTYGLDNAAMQNMIDAFQITRPAENWATTEGAVQATRDTVLAAIGSTETLLAQARDRLGILRQMETDYRDLGNDLKNFAIQMLDSYLTWDQAKTMAGGIQNKLAEKTASLTESQARDLLILLG